MKLLRVSLAVAPLALLAACTINPRPVVVNTPPAVVAPAAVATVPAGTAVVPAPTAATPAAPVVMGAPGTKVIEIPPGAYPPAGSCRVWVPGLPLSQQQLPGNCADLQNRVPVGGILLRG